METEAQTEYCLYARKSSESDERQAMSIDSQIKEMLTMADKEGLKVVGTKTESHSAKLSGSRPIFTELINDIKEAKFNGILTWAPDRLSRNAGDLGSLVDLMDTNQLVQIRTYSQRFGNNPSEKFLLMILCSQAKLENDNRAESVKRGIRAKCERGWRPCMPPLGYYTRASTGGERDTIVDQVRAPHIIRAFEMSASGKSGRHIKQYYIDNEVMTRKNKTISLSMIYSLLKNTFYYGEFEYPVSSGNWYQGKHEPLINKGLFDEVQAQLIVPQKSKWGAKEFPFKQFLKCASCGSTVVGEEKYKQRKDGGSNRHVYYHCSRKVDYNCKEPYAKEADIVGELLAMSEELLASKDSLESGLQTAINRFTEMMLIANEDYNFQKARVDYARYVLTKGSGFEKSRLVRNISKKLVLKNRKLIGTG